MGNKIIYIIIFLWAKVHALLPVSMLYLLSDILYYLMYYLAGYRKKVVRKNIRNAFPEKSKKERITLERRFYHHFADYITETIKLAGMSQKELLRRAHINNPDLIYELSEKGHKCFILMMGHYGNWEWFSGTAARFEDRVKVYQVYRPLTGKAFDRLFLFLRTRFGSFSIKKQEAVRDMINIKRSEEPSLIVFLSDQTPSKANLHYRTTFLNQETFILTGPERIAKKLNIPVLFSDVTKIKRGYYTVDFKLITASPRETSEFWITEQYARLMEKNILRDPAYWLWTHKRWKHQKQITNR